MTITAKYAGKCTKCEKSIHPGDRIEWTKGSKSYHTDCSADPSSKTAATPSRSPYRRRVCVECGMPEFGIDSDGECQGCRDEREMGY